MNHSVAIIGGGPAGLMAAEVLIQRGVSVDVYDSMPSLGRKFLLAGKSGLNLTHSEPFEKFVSRYGKRRKEIEKWLLDFMPDDLREWARRLGVETFVGTSGRVFPNEMKASPLLRAWLKGLSDAGVIFHLRHRWNGTIRPEGLFKSGDASNQTYGTIEVEFETPDGIKIVNANAVILALGGGSWARLGSDGAWVNWLNQAGVKVEALKPSNCGFDVAWTPIFKEKFDGQPIKSVVLSFGTFHQQGEFIVTKEGVEGSLIYAASAWMRDEISANGKAVMLLDLAPDKTEAQLTEKLSKPRGSRSMASHLEKTVGMKGVKAGLLREFVPKDEFGNSERLAFYIKQLPVPLIATRPLDEAISSAGGVAFEALDDHLMIVKLPGVFCAGEMLDWEAPTGGYLLTACFASGRKAGAGAMKWIEGL
ncbi:TIGR03862 family flavoprotein [Candidatus Villigracilis saccharophilus]|uniref:TIGR03862 family flavoprotein n=1 Tax=Candidatus Villigracilis saccharophilus TaxID=3140684 RepID=UPI003134FC4E|nr:TIGR03862 family flavoprotein [Anaerolineales bacterium]